MNVHDFFTPIKLSVEQIQTVCSDWVVLMGRHVPAVDAIVATGAAECISCMCCGCKMNKFFVNSFANQNADNRIIFCMQCKNIIQQLPDQLDRRVEVKHVDCWPDIIKYWVHLAMQSIERAERQADTTMGKLNSLPTIADMDMAAKSGKPIHTDFAGLDFILKQLAKMVQQTGGVAAGIEHYKEDDCSCDNCKAETRPEASEDFLMKMRRQNFGSN